MSRYVAFLRGVMPTNCTMPALRASFQAAGFTNVRTVLGSGNVVFDCDETSEATIEARAEAAMQATLGRSFYTIVRMQQALHALLEIDARHSLAPSAKRVISFFRAPPTARQALPLSDSGASVFLVRGREAFTAYEPSEKGPVFMTLIERAFGKDVTTRTRDTVAKCALA
jgi:uncharacterized protein (DUF1697 family)